MVAIWQRSTKRERRGEKYFARATNDAGQKQTGGYATPMADVWAKIISPLQMDDWGCKGVCVYLDNRQRPGRRSGNGVPSANVGAKYFSPGQMDDWRCEEVYVRLDVECAAVLKPSPFWVSRA